jgi:hypothetical protein
LRGAGTRAGFARVGTQIARSGQGSEKALRKQGVVVYQIQTHSAPSRRRSLIVALLGGLIGGGLVNGCASQMTCESPTDPCVESGGPAEAAVTAVAAGALWAGNGGCATAGCRSPYVCNTGSGLCEHMPCGESRGSCPPGTQCDVLTSTCR